MIQEFVDRWEANKESARSAFQKEWPNDYQSIVKTVITTITKEEGYYDEPDPSRIHTIDDGDYQGTLLFVIASFGYQPSDYWFVKVGYGSCSGCDALQALSGYGESRDVDQLMKLALHVVQGLKVLGGESV